MTKKDYPISTRIDEHLNKRLESIIERTGKTKGEQVRVAVKRFVEISERLETGESINWIPKLELEAYRKTLTELDEVLDMANDLKLSESTIKVINSVIDTLEWSLLSELKKKYPNQNGFFNIR